MSPKEPWQVFHDELRRQIGRHRDDDGSDGAMRVPEVDVPRMSTEVANVVLEHLTDVEGLGPEQALEVTKLFFAEIGRVSEEPVGQRLKAVWESWRKTV